MRRGLGARGLLLALLGVVGGLAAWRAGIEAREGPDAARPGGAVPEASPAPRPALAGRHAPEGRGPEELLEASAAGGDDLVDPRPGPGVVLGTLVDVHGAPVAGEWVAVLAARVAPEGSSEVRDGGPFAGATWERTDARGRFRFAGLQGPRWLLVRGTRDALPVLALVRAGDPVVALRREDRPTVEVVVLDAAGSPLADAAVRVEGSREEEGTAARPREQPPVAAGPVPEDLAGWLAADGPGGRAEGATDASGHARLRTPTGGPPYLLTVAPPGPEHRGVRAVPWSPADGPVRLERAFLVEGVVNATDGTRVTQGRVLWRTPPTPTWSTARLDGEGAFRLDGLAAGDVILRPVAGDIPPGDPREAAGETCVAAGRRDVVLTVDVGDALVVRLEGWPASAVGAVAFLSEEAAGSESPRRWRADVGPGGVVAFRGLRAGRTFAFWAPPSVEALVAGDPRGPLCAHRRGIPAEAGAVSVPLVVGGTLRAEVVPAPLRGGPPAAWARATGVARILDDVVVLGAPLAADGERGTLGFTLAGLPEGTWEVEVEVHGEEAWRGRATLSTEAGGQRVLVRPPDPASAR